MADLLSLTIAGNTIIQYLLFLGVIILSFVGVKIVYFLFEKIFLSLASKTKSQLDDILIKALRKPIVFGVVIVSFHYARQLLVLSSKVDSIYTQIITVLIIFDCAWFIVRLSNGFIKNYVSPLTESPKYKIDETIYQTLIRLVNVLVYAIALVVILQNLGVKVTGVVAGLGIGGLAFALAAQDIIGNMFGGAAVIMDKPFKVGDRVKVAGQDGFVSKISLRTTTLETFGKTHVVMPNKTIADSVLENVSREDMRREKLVVGLEYGTSAKDLEKAKKILKNIIVKNSKTDDESMVHFVNFGSSTLDVQVIYWIKDLSDILGTKDEVNMVVKKEFDKQGLSFAFPTQTIHVQK
ncbi:MAG: mechanosensitive ion channel family protein [Nanobdellota archaeon]